MWTPSPNSQNLRSAPQKQPMPNIALSKPSGYGPLSGRCKTKCSRAVGIGVERPGSASAADGISSFFLNMNMAASPVGRRLNIGRAPATRTSWLARLRITSPDAARGSRRVRPHRRFNTNEGREMAPRRQGRDPFALIPRVSDQRLFLSPEQDQNCADDGEHQRDRLIEKVRLDQALPDPRPRPALDLRLQRRQGVLVDIRPSRTHAADIDGLVRYRLGAVIDQEDKSQGERQQTDEPKNKAD